MAQFLKSAAFNSLNSDSVVGRVELDSTLPTCEQGNFSQVTARNRNRILVTVVRDTRPTTVPPAPPKVVIT